MRTITLACQLVTLLSALALAASARAEVHVIDFGTAPANVPAACAGSGGAPKTCSTYNTLLQSYGDVEGLVDVTTHASRGGALQWFNTGYNDLYGVAFDNVPSVNAPQWVDLVPLNGNVITLEHFDLGGYFQSQRRNVELDVFAIGSETPLFSQHGAIGTPGGPVQTGHASAFDLNLSSATGIRIQWRDLDNAANTGIDNITYSVAAPVPEPADAWMIGAGLVSMGAFVRRSRRRT
jgi:hypothetical protein